MSFWSSKPTQKIAEEIDAVLSGIAQDDLFFGGQRDQVMLFDTFRDDDDFDPILDEEPQSTSSLPPYLLQLLDEIRDLITPSLPTTIADTLFNQLLARQVIINLYSPGEGITPHIDLPHRYADGILGVSLCGGCVMDLQHRETGEKHHIYLPPRTVYCLAGEARWEWSHGIVGRKVDIVREKQGSKTIMRDLRVSVTFRWMKEGADELV